MSAAHFDDFCPLLGLPQELRDRVYECMMEGEGRHRVCIWEDGRLVVPQALAQTCRQLRHEGTFAFTPIDFSEIQQVYARIANFDFNSIYKACHRLQGSCYRMELQIAVTLTSPLEWDRGGVERWLRQCKRGWAGAAFRRRYVVTFECSQDDEEAWFGVVSEVCGDVAKARDDVDEIKAAMSMAQVGTRSRQTQPDSISRTAIQHGPVQMAEEEEIC